MKSYNTAINEKGNSFTVNLINEKNRFNPINLELKMNPNEKELEQAKQLLAGLSNIKYPPLPNNAVITSLNNSTDFLYDGYDSFAQHLIVKDLNQNKVVAYVRIIDTKTACDIGGYFCETQFNLKNLHFKSYLAMELSHIVVDPKCSNENCIELLWSGINQYAEEREIDTIFGTISLNIENSHYPATREINNLKSKYLSSNQYRVKPYNILPPSRAVAGETYEFPEIVEFIFNQGAMLCGDACWNNTLNQAEIIFYIAKQSNQKTMDHFYGFDISQSDLVA